MKNHVLFILFSICSTLLISCSKAPNPTIPNGLEGTSKTPVESPNIPGVAQPQGTDFGSGGDAYAAEFIDIARTVVRRWNGIPEKMIGDNHIGKASVEKFEQIVNTLKVKTTEEALKWGDQRVDALNYPEKGLIVLSLVQWPTAAFSEKRRLVIHEILGLMGIELSLSYDLTLNILSQLDFYREIPIYSFLVDGKPAQTLVEKIKWLPGEISVDKEGDDTTYRLPVTGKRKDELECVKAEYGAPEERFFLYRCYIHCDAFMTDEPSIRLKPDWDGELHKRLFMDKDSFDYGFVKGEGGSTLFTSVLLYFDRPKM